MSSEFDYVVVGSGAIGGTVGARMVRAGHSVLFCDADPAHVAALNESGLAVEGPVEEFTVAAVAVTPEQLPAGLGTVLLAVKSQHTADALGEIVPRLAPDGRHAFAGIVAPDDIPVTRRVMVRGEPEHGLERDVPVEAPIVSEDKLVEIGVDVLAAQPVIGAQPLTNPLIF